VTPKNINGPKGPGECVKMANTVAIKVASKGPRGGKAIITRKATPRLINGWWKASVTLAGETVKVYRKSGRGKKTYVPGTHEYLTVRELKAVNAL